MTKKIAQSSSEPMLIYEINMQKFMKDRRNAKNNNNNNYNVNERMREMNVEWHG